MTLLLIVSFGFTAIVLFHKFFPKIVNISSQRKHSVSPLKNVVNQAISDHEVGLTLEGDTFQQVKIRFSPTDEYADEILSQIFEIACPTSKNCLEVLVLLEQLKRRISPIHLKRMRLLFNVYGSTNHLFDAAFVSVVGSCTNCIEKFELIEYVYTRSRFYPSIARPVKPQGGSDIANLKKVRTG